MSKPKMYLSMIGAAGDEVTGSGSLIRIECKDKTYYGLIDAGIVQGANDFRNFNYPIDAKNLDFVIITHAHADHFLASPLLRGFKGKIYATNSTFNQGKELLDDAVYNYESRAAGELGISYEAYRDMCKELENLSRRKNAYEIERYQELMIEIDEVRSYALYTMSDVDEVKKHFYPIVPYQDFMIADGIYLRLIPSTHQNGSVNVELYVGDYLEDSINVSFSGDIGPLDSFLYRNHKYNKNMLINYCVMEALHGLEDRTQTPEEAYRQIKSIILPSLKSGKTIILVGFALDRCAMLVYSINRIMREEKIKPDVYLDSPLAIKELMNYQIDYSNKKNYWFKDLGEKPFGTDDIIIAGKYTDHINIVRDKNPKVIITASAFGEGGRVLDYFDHYIQEKDAIFVFSGWLNPDCASNILHSAPKGKIIEIHGNHYVKYCDTIQISGFSAHGYYPEYVEYIERFPNLKGIILNHSRTQTKNELAKELGRNYNVDIHIPEMFDSVQKSFYSITSEGIKEISAMEGYDVFKDVIKSSTIA